MKRILFCNPLPITKELGASKVTTELTEAMREIGWDCTLVGSNEIITEAARGPIPYREALRLYLQRHAADYDVVDYDHEHLPYPRSDFTMQTLFVARSVLLLQHLESIRIPQGQSVRKQIGALLKGPTRRERLLQTICYAQATVEAADLVNVSNQDDKTELVRRGLAPEKIVVIPFGISPARRELFDQVSSAVPKRPTVAFVGSFDYRKGAAEFPAIVQGVADAIPEARFRLLGTKGLFQTESAILHHFPARLRGRLEIIMKYRSEELPTLLSDCAVGVFPSHLEGFGFGVLEMLAASVPVIAYEAPGPPMMLPADYLVAPGDAKAMSRKVVALLIDDKALSAARSWAKRRSQDFNWIDAAAMTDEHYTSFLASREMQI